MDEALELEHWFRERGVEVYLEEMTPSGDYGICPEEPTHIPKTINWLVVLGGDGTLLGAARKIGRYGVPILGVNLGGLGFLTSIPLNRLPAALEMMLENRLEIENRLMLETKIMRGDRETSRLLVLNDVVINKSTLARIIDLDVYINDQFLTTFRADGLIISTPTGSTAYNLSAGGPILYPTVSNFILTPICPFTLTNRPIIVPDSDTIIIRMEREVEGTVTLTFDGQLGLDLTHEDHAVICKSKQKIRLIKSPDQGYFEILRTKLMWGGTTFNKNGNP
jgi:NAD+ kinase